MSVRIFEGHTPRIADSAYVDEHALVIGDVHLGEDSSVWPMSVVRGDVNSIRIGARTNIQDGSVVHVTHDCEYSPGGYAVTIGDDVTVGHRVIVHACEIGDRCLIGMGSVILDGAVIEPDSMIGAGCLVPPRETPRRRLPLDRQPGPETSRVEPRRTGIPAILRGSLRRQQEPSQS